MDFNKELDTTLETLSAEAFIFGSYAFKRGTDVPLPDDNHELLPVEKAKQAIQDLFIKLVEEQVQQSFKNSTYQNIDGDAKYWGKSGGYNKRSTDKFFPQEWFDNKFLPQLRKALINSIKGNQGEGV